jgi:hypothetical protein
VRMTIWISAGVATVSLVALAALWSSDSIPVAELPPVSAAKLDPALDLPLVDPIEVLLPSERQVYYQYVDETGAVRFTQNPWEVPEAWRDRAGRIELDVAPPNTPADARLVRKLRAGS